MIETTYLVSNITYIIILGLLFGYNKASHVLQTKADKPYKLLVLLVILFCTQDAVWGLAAGPFIQSKKFLYHSSVVFFISTAIATFIWLNYVLIFLGNQVKKPNTYRILGIFIIIAQIFLIFLNFKKPIIFYIASPNLYIRGEYFYVLYLLQYVEYIIALIITTCYLLKSTDENKQRYITISAFIITPIICGFLQARFINIPFYSLGYFLGCFIINIYIITIEKEDKLIQESMIDKLTGFYNRKAYEENFINKINEINTNNLIYISMDVNSLKETNDTYGHMAGDELLCGAAKCINEAFGRYGNLYRTGGDEFIAVIFLDSLSFRQLIDEFERLLAQWKGNFSSDLSISYGFVEKTQEQDKSIAEIISIADKRMYHNKNQYYLSKGINRKIQKEALALLSNYYTKILRINLSTDRYSIIKLIEEEKTTEKGYDKVLSVWLNNFASSIMIHPDDKQNYLNLTKYEFLRNYFLNGNNDYKCYYRRYFNGSYKTAMLEIIKAPEFTPDNMLLYLYLKDIDMKD